VHANQGFMSSGSHRGSFAARAYKFIVSYAMACRATCAALHLAIRFRLWLKWCRRVANLQEIVKFGPDKRHSLHGGEGTLS
jgi:hypothetical protein